MWHKIGQSFSNSHHFIVTDIFDQMLTILIVIFVIAYAAIALEHPIKINKSASAILGAGLLWTVYAIMTDDHHLVGHQLNESLASTAQIVFFLMGAMTIVEVVDAHNGFEVITSRIRTTKLSTLMWLVGFVSFFLSAVIDNLTTTIVMISLMKKLLENHEDRLFFAGMIVIAANAGGAWSPIGDVTTTMLWIGGQITALVIMKGVVAVLLVNLILPLAVTSYLLKGREVVAPARVKENGLLQTTSFERNLMFFMGIGILISVATLEHTHILGALAKWLDQTVGRQDVIVTIIGLVSAIVDNVPLVAASMGMYSLAQYPTDSFLWEFMAYCAGTGGSILIIGSAAGVAAMGLEKIHFFWYVKRISGLALIGYFCGIAAYIVQYRLFH